VLLDHRSAVADFFDSAQVEALYADEVVAAIRAHTGADCVAPLGWMIRTSGDPGRYARQFPGQMPYRRFLYTSFWRAFSPGPQDYSLALCDGRTVGDEEGTTNTLHVVDRLPSREQMLQPMQEESSKPAAAIFRYNPAWRWWYFSNMTRAEALLFKFHDSRRRRPWRVPHTAFQDGMPKRHAYPREHRVPLGGVLPLNRCTGPAVHGHRRSSLQPPRTGLDELHRSDERAAALPRQ
jgi:hypothetical protein